MARLREGKFDVLFHSKCGASLKKLNDSFAEFIVYADKSGHTITNQEIGEYLTQMVTFLTNQVGDKSDAEDILDEVSRLV
jgi:hypothetical protein